LNQLLAEDEDTLNMVPQWEFIPFIQINFSWSFPMAN